MGGFLLTYFALVVEFLYLINAWSHVT